VSRGEQWVKESGAAKSMSIATRSVMNTPSVASIDCGSLRVPSEWRRKRFLTGRFVAIDCILPSASKCAIGVSTYYLKFPWRKRGTQGHSRAFKCSFGLLRATLIIGAATANKVFDTLTSGAKNVEEVSRKTGASVRGCAHHERTRRPRIAEESGDKYALTPESEAFLVSNKPGTLAGFFSMNRMRMMQQWMKLDEIVRTGRRRRREIRRDPGQSFSATGREHHSNELRFRTALAEH